MDKKSLPSGSQQRVLRALERCGASPAKDRGKGSHRVVKLAGRFSVVQYGTITQGMVKKILGDLELDAQTFIDAWR